MDINYKIKTKNFLILFNSEKNLTINVFYHYNTFFLNITEICKYFNKDLSKWFSNKKTKKIFNNLDENYIVGLNIKKID